MIRVLCAADVNKHRPRWPPTEAVKSVGCVIFFYNRYCASEGRPIPTKLALNSFTRGAFLCPTVGWEMAQNGQNAFFRLSLFVFPPGGPFEVLLLITIILYDLMIAFWNSVVTVL